MSDVQMVLDGQRFDELVKAIERKVSLDLRTSVAGMTGSPPPSGESCNGPDWMGANEFEDLVAAVETELARSIRLIGQAKRPVDTDEPVVDRRQVVAGIQLGPVVEAVSAVMAASLRLRC